MIIRMLHEGQYELPPEALSRLRALDDQLMESVAAGDQKGFEERRDELVALVRSEGKPLRKDILRESDLVLPGAVHHCGVNNWVKDGVNITPNI